MERWSWIGVKKNKKGPQEQYLRAINTIMDEEKFRIKTYGFGELAQLYLPDANPMSASNRLRIWITRNKTLMDKLHNLGYVKKTRLLTPEMVKEIVAVIGEPWSFPTYYRKERSESQPECTDRK